MTPGKINTSLHDDNESSLAHETSIKNENSNLEHKIINNKKLNSNSHNGSDGIDISDSDKNEPINCKDEKLKMEVNKCELLGSLTSISSPGVRTSARVIQKMKMDLNRPTTPPPSDKKEVNKDDRGTQKTPNQAKPQKPIWTNTERKLFFDALNDCGKEFDAIAQFINTKLKRKNSSDPAWKTKEHVRHLYYQTFHKISKNLKFSDDVKRYVQELYALINYGEIRKKVPLDNQKIYMKLPELVYKGSVNIRVKGKNYRVKTPPCKALRKINQVDETHEDIQLPAKVEVMLKPADYESWCNVQSLAQNPRVKTTLPLQKRLISLIKTLQFKWRSRDAKLIEQANTIITSMITKANSSVTQTSSSSTSTTPSSSSSSNSTVYALGPSTSKTLSEISTSESSCQTQQSSSSPSSSNGTFQYIEPLLCVTPHQEATIHRPYVNLSELLSSYNLCLNSYEERIGAGVRGEELSAEYMVNFKEMIKSNAKRQRHDSGSEKKSPDMKRVKSSESESLKPTVDQDEVKKSLADNSVFASGDEIISEEKYENDYVASGSSYDGNLFEMEGICQITESSSADECDKEDGTKMTIKSEQITDNSLGSEKSFKPETMDLQEPVIIVPDCIKQNLAGRNKPPKNNLATNKKRNKDLFRPLVNEEVIKKIRRGWTVDDVGDITIGDLYLMFGQDSKILLEYKWIPTTQNEMQSDTLKTAKTLNKENEADGTKNVQIEVETESKPKVDVLEKPKNTLSNRLKQLLMLANMTEKTKRRTSCVCGHVCDRNLNKVKKDEMVPRSYVSNKIYPSSHTDSTVFRQPVLPSRSAISQIDAYRLSLPNSRNRWQKLRNNRTSKQLVVQRLLPLQPGMPKNFGLVTPASDIKYGSVKLDDTLRKQLRAETETSSSLMNESGSSFVKNQKIGALDMSKLLEIDDEYDTSNLETENDKRNVTETTSETTQQLNNTICNDKLTMDNELEAEELDVDEQDEEDTIRRRLNEDPGIQSLMELSLPSPIPTSSTSDEYFTDLNATPPMSPMTILHEAPSDPKWFEENMADFSLSSFLGHLDSAVCDSNSKQRFSSPNAECDGSNLSTISESSIDYIKKFEELAESMKNEANNLLLQ